MKKEIRTAWLADFGTFCLIIAIIEVILPVFGISWQVPSVKLEHIMLGYALATFVPRWLGAKPETGII